MKRAAIKIAMLVLSHCAFAQDPIESTQLPKTQLPDVVLASPTVASLMRFEEVPVSEYTGIPSVSIPFYSENLAPNLTLGISLSYHPSGIAVDELASWTGNGWSLEAGGSVSRIMKGNPDESESTWAPGIYNSAFEDIYDVGLFKNGTMTVLDNDANEELLWKSINPREFTPDTQYDVYQYNFMGYSGRFIVTKYGEVIQGQQDSPLRISLVVGDHITIVNEYGYIFRFSIKEITTTLEDVTTGTYQKGAGSFSSGMDINGGHLESPFVSAYHLSSIMRENTPLVTFSYSPVKEIYQTPKVITKSHLVYDGSTHVHFQRFPENNFILVPQESTNQKKMSILTQKLDKITISGKSTIAFLKLDGRPDYLQDTDNLYTGTKLTDILIKDSDGVRTKRFQFEYVLGGASRLFLNGIKEYGSTDSGSLRYNFTYDRPETLPARFSNNVDFWGYFNGASNIDGFPKSIRDGLLTGADKEVNIAKVTTGVLQSVQFPSGGKLLMEFESNTSSYQGSQPLEKEHISENLELDANVGINGVGNYTYTNPYSYIYADFDQSVSMNMIITNYGSVSPLHTKNFMYEFLPIKPPPNQTGPYYNYAAFLDDPSRPSFSISLSESGCGDNYCTLPVTLKRGTYKVRLKPKTLMVTSMTSINYSLTFSIYKYDWNQYYTKGGGIRIKKMQYTDKPKNPADLMAPDQILKTKHYSYQDPGNANMSSGSFSFNFPKYYYENMVNTAIVINSLGLCQPNKVYADFDMNYKTYTNFNSHNPIMTKGAYIGYKYVKVSEEGNGHIQYTFTSPIDFPEDPFVNYTYPFTSGRNLDYKRGLTLNEKTYDASSKPLKEVLSDYNYIEKLPVIGLLALNQNGGCGYSRLFQSYNDYLNDVLSNTNVCVANCGIPSLGVSFLIEKPASGWAQLKEKRVLNYFYETENAPATIVTEKMEYAYNDLNKRVSTMEKTDSEGKVTKIKYYYPDDVASATSLSGGSFTATEMEAINQMKEANRHHIALPVQTESYIDNQLTAVQRTLYKNWGSYLFAPEIMQTSKGTGPLENTIRYNALDSNGNPLEVQQEGGTIISYIWGYNKTLPIAKIENATNAEIKTALGVTDLTLVNEANLTDINNLRALLPNAMVTTYTYKPLVGISTVTDPKGDKATYHYDSFGRLESVRDRDGNILSENQYRYRTQN